MAAIDGQTFEQQGEDVIRMFRDAFGDNAEAEWERQHNEAVGGGGQPATPPPPAPSQPSQPSQPAPVAATPLGGVNLKDVSDKAMQSYFNNALLLSQQAINQLKSTGATPLMRWDANAYGPGIGGFVATATLIPTLEAVNQKFAINRAQIDQVARIMYQTGRAPRLKVNDQGMMVLQTDAQGNPVFDETVENRAQRLAAGTAVGFVSTDLMQAPKSGEAVGSATPGAATGQQLQPPPTNAPSGAGNPLESQTWDNISEETRQQFADTWGIPAAQARWEWENAKNAGQDPGTWEEYARMRGVPEEEIQRTNQLDQGGAQSGTPESGFTPSAEGGEATPDQEGAGDVDPWASVEAPAASDGATLKEQDDATKNLYLSQYGSPDAAALAWQVEHDKDLSDPTWRDVIGDGGDLNTSLAQQWLDATKNG